MPGDAASPASAPPSALALLVRTVAYSRRYLHWIGLAAVFAYMGAQRHLPADSAFPLVLEPAERAMALDSTSARV